MLTGALVQRLIIFEGNRAVGVEYRAAAERAPRNGGRRSHPGGPAPSIPRSSCSCPAWVTPHQLAAAGITPRHALAAVGAHLNDHPDIVIQHRCAEPVSIYPANRGMGKIIAGLRWFAGLDGLAANSNHFEAGGFIRSRAGIEYPDLQLTFMPLAIKPGTVDDVGMHSFQVHIDLMRPKSLGSVEIRCADPAAAPSICFNYLSDPQDREDLRTSVRLTREILAQPALARATAREELNPGDAVRTDADMDAWIRRGVETCYHPVGTCRMGQDRERLGRRCRNAGCMASTRCGWSMPPSCRPSSAAIPTRRPS